MTCEFCGGDLYAHKPKSGTGGQKRKFCSRKCRNNAAWHKEKLGPFTGNCKRCGATWVSDNQKRVYCGNECARKASIDRGSKRWAENNPKPEFYEYQCKFCHNTWKQPTIIRGAALMHGVYCPDHRKLGQAARYRAKTVKRQQAGVRPSRIVVEQLVAIYGEVCYLCNEPIDMAIPRTSRMGATVEHIIPLSKGGTDELENLQLAHWICNNAKSDKLIEGINA